MKIIYSDLKKLIPGLKTPVHQLANQLTMIGHFSEGIESRQGEEILGLEIRQNRGDCLSYWGIAKELSVCLNQPLKIEQINLNQPSQFKLPIKVGAKETVKRIMAVKLTGLTNKTGSACLQKFLRLNGINPINAIVDLTNFIMLWYGIPSHAFDAKKSTDNLTWRINNNRYHQLTTLDGTRLNLAKNTLVIDNGQTALSLGMIGGKKAAIDLDTKELILEMAIYDRVQIKQDSRNLKVATEAGSRLEKDLDPELIPQAFNHLVSLILKTCGGQVASQIFDFYPQKPVLPIIELDLKTPGRFAGINISSQFAKEILRRLGAQIKPTNQNNIVKVTPPTGRKDLNLEEDLIEEIIRFYGYDKIPTNQPITKQPLTDITPSSFCLNTEIKEKLARHGYDEIRSWPLIEEKHFHPNRTTELKGIKKIYTENNINNNYPLLRQAIVSSLINQKEQLEKFKIEDINLFEIGKVFYRHQDKYLEHYSLGLLGLNKTKLEKDIGQLLSELNVPGLSPAITPVKDFFVAEINLKTVLAKMKSKPKDKIINYPDSPQSVQELTKQIVSLDANVVVTNKIEPADLIKNYLKKLKNQPVWQIKIIDIYKTQSGFKYTLRVSYYNLTQKQARNIHLQVFRLI